MVEGHLQGGVGGLVGLLDAALQQGEDIVGEHGNGEAEQGRTRMPEAAEFAVQHRLEPLEHSLHRPATMVKSRDLSRGAPGRGVSLSTPAWSRWNIPSTDQRRW